MDIPNLSDKELIEIYKECYDSVYNIECYGMRDLYIIELAREDLTKRGYKMEKTLNINWVKGR